jgi:hypothetical protein
LVRDDLLESIERRTSDLEQLASAPLSVSRDERRHIEPQAREHLTGVAGARPPSHRLALDHKD